MKGSKKSIYSNRIIILIFITLLLTTNIANTLITSYLVNKKIDVKTEKAEKKLSPYTLDEIYSIIEDPVKFNELSNEKMATEFNEVLFHFYDYFSETTPFKKAKKVIVDNDPNKTFHVVKVLETEYISYYEYMDFMKNNYEDEENTKKLTGYDSEDTYYGYDYRTWVELLVYNYNTEIVIENEK